MEINSSGIPTPANPISSQPPKKIPWLAIIVIIIILLIGAGYLLLGKPGTGIKKQPPLTISQQTPSQNQDNLDNGLNSINVDIGSDSDFASIDQDLKQL